MVHDGALQRSKRGTSELSRRTALRLRQRTRLHDKQRRKMISLHANQTASRQCCCVSAQSPKFPSEADVPLCFGCITPLIQHKHFFFFLSAHWFYIGSESLIARLKLLSHFLIVFTLWYMWCKMDHRHSDSLVSLHVSAFLSMSGPKPGIDACLYSLTNEQMRTQSWISECLTRVRSASVWH